MADQRAAVVAGEMDSRTSGCCGHEFQTRRQRVEHEQRVMRGERVVCPCGDVCSEGDDDGV